MRIAILADPLDNQRAGVHVYVRELVHALAADPGEHEYILIREKADPALPLRQIEVANVRLPIGYASFRLFFIIPRLLRKLKVDAVFEPAHFGPFNLPDSIRRITMIHDLTPILFPEFHVWHGQQLQRLFLGRILGRADLVISNSLNTQRDLERVYPVTGGKIETILLGRNESFRPVVDRDFLAAHQITSPYFLYVGTIEPRKNLILLLDAYSRFRKRARAGQQPAPQSVTAQLVLVGQTGWKNSKFHEALAGHPYKEDIILTGYVPKKQLLQAYSHALALVYPSIYEGFGFPILEALSCATNVICPDNSSLPEVGGDLAYYYPTFDAEALAEVMHTILGGGPDVERRASSGPGRAATFSWASYARYFNEAMSELAVKIH